MDAYSYIYIYIYMWNHVYTYIYICVCVGFRGRSNDQSRSIKCNRTWKRMETGFTSGHIIGIIQKNYHYHGEIYLRFPLL